MYLVGMKMPAIFPMILVTALACMAQDPPSRFSFQPDPLDIGTIEQGTSKHVVLKGKNATKDDIKLETVISQNSGASNFNFPANVAAGQPVTIEFDVSTAHLEGPLNFRIVLVEKDGRPSVTSLTGMVDAPVLYSRQILDAGYVTPGAKPTWTFYAWNPASKPIDLSLDSAAALLYTLKTSPVKLDTKKFDDIKEGGAVPGLKLTLTAKDMGQGPVIPKQRSIRQIIGMKTAQWPKATPEVLIVGYWK